MATQPLSFSAASSAPAKVSILQLLFLLLGAPNLFGVQKAAEQPRSQRLPALQYLSLAMLALAIASVTEMWIL